MDYESVFDHLEEQIEQIGYKPAIRDQLEIEEGDQTITYHFINVEIDAGPDFSIFSREGDELCKIQSDYALWADIASQVSDEQIEELVDSEAVKNIPDDHPVREIPVDLEDLDEQPMKKLLAAMEILSGMGQEARQETIYQLTDIFTSSEVKHVIDSTSGEDGLTGFTVYHKIFPQEDEFGLSELNEAVEKVRMSAHRAELFLRYAFDLGVDMGRNGAQNVGDSIRSPPSK